MSDTTLMEFPCRFSIKAFGKQDPAFEQTVFDLVRAHVPELTPDDLTQKASSRRRYVSVTVTIIAQSRAQLDAIYQDLTDHDAVVMSL